MTAKNAIGSTATTGARNSGGATDSGASVSAETQAGPVIRVILAEDHTIVREGLRALLDACEGVQVVAEVGNGRAAVEAVASHRPDVIVMDLGMPELNGVDATRLIRERFTDTQVLILSMHSSEEYVRPAIRAGANGYLVKGSGLSDLVSAITALADGEAFFSPTIAKILLQESRRAAAPKRPQASDGLTNRERQVLKLVAEGKSSPAIAQLLSLSVKTVEGHRSRIMAKIETHNVAGMVRHAIRIGLVSAED
ncbi:MAG TPA: response regulator transcription factor [Nannocystis exedens]|nr:response regulator transcription factor [Nannocystis exedens]